MAPLAKLLAAEMARVRMTVVNATGGPVDVDAKGWPKGDAKMRPDLLRRPAVPADPFDLHPRRVHEAEGRGRRAFALFQAARHPGPLVDSIALTLLKGKDDRARDSFYAARAYSRAQNDAQIGRAHV